MPVEFLTDVQAAGYAAFQGAPPRSELERFFFLDDADRELIEGKRRARNRLGFAVQMTTARYLGVFLDNPTDVPTEVVGYLAEQLAIADPSVLKAYGERENTRLEHVRELRRTLEYREFAGAEAELREWVDARAWTTGEGPKALFDAAAGWLRERRVLLPGVTTLARLVASVREAANQRLWDTLYGMLSTGQRAVLDSLLTVPAGARPPTRVDEGLAPVFVRMFLNPPLEGVLAWRQGHLGASPRAVSVGCDPTQSLACRRVHPRALCGRWCRQ